MMTMVMIMMIMMKMMMMMIKCCYNHCYPAHPSQNVEADQPGFDSDDDQEYEYFGDMVIWSQCCIYPVFAQYDFFILPVTIALIDHHGCHVFIIIALSLVWLLHFARDQSWWLWVLPHHGQGTYIIIIIVVIIDRNNGHPNFQPLLSSWLSWPCL